MLQLLAPLAEYALPVGIGAVTSGLQAAGQGKDLGEIATASLLGGGLGLGVGAGGRMAGQALANSPLASKIAPDVFRLFAGKAATNSTPLINQQLRGIDMIGKAGNIATQTLGGLAIPGIASAVASPITGAARTATNAAGRVAGAGAKFVPGIGPNSVDTSGAYDPNAVPKTGMFGTTPVLGENPLQVLDPTGRFAASRTASEKQTDTEVRNFNAIAAAQAPWIRGVKKEEYLRQLAAAGIRNNLQTQQSMLLYGLANARQMGLNASNQVGQALAAQYQYS